MTTEPKAGSGCMCDPAGSDGLRCPNKDGHPLCAVPVSPEQDAAIDEALGLVKVTMRFPKRLMDEIDAGAAEAGLIRVAMIRSLVDYALNGPTPSAVEALARAAKVALDEPAMLPADWVSLKNALAHPEIAALKEKES